MRLSDKCALSAYQYHINALLISLGKKTLKSCQCDSSFDSELCFDSEIRLAFENRFDSERVVVQSCPDLNDDAYSDYPELNDL